MNASEHIETLVGLLTSAVIAGAWWFAAIRFRRQGLLYGLAVVATIGTLLSFAIALVVDFSTRIDTMHTLLHFQPVCDIADAVLYILFVCWLVRQRTVLEKNER